MLLRSTRLASHLTEDRLPLHEIDPVGARAWQVADDRVMGILCMSVEVLIRASFINMSSAKEMWEYL